MATVPTVQVWSIGQYVTSSQMNAGIGNVLSWLLSPPKATIYRNAALSVAASTTTVVPWTSEVIDTDTMWASGTASRLKFNTAGSFAVEAVAHFSGISTGQVYMAVCLNSNGSLSNRLVEQALPNVGTGFFQSLNLSFSYFFNAGDYIEMFVNQTTTGPVNAFPGGAYFDGHFGGRWISNN